MRAGLLGLVGAGCVGHPEYPSTTLECLDWGPQEVVVLDSTAPELIGAPVTMYRHEMTIEYVTGGRTYVARYRYCATKAECDQLGF